MTEFEPGYQTLDSVCGEDENEEPPTDSIIHVVPDRKQVRWNHIENLDEFFTRVYQYHQRSGFFCMLVQDLLQLLQFVFVVLFSLFLWKCVDYDVLFYEKQYNSTHKVTIGEAIYPLPKCAARFDFFIGVCLFLAALFFIFRLAKVIYNVFHYFEIRAFYVQALRITSEELANMTWHEVQRRLLEVQKEQQMCIHKQELTELDIYHRILRFKNYMVSMVNKSLLSLKFQVPFVGEYVFLSMGLKYNLEMILFWGPWSPFENYWHLKADFKNYHKRKELADQLSKKILWIGLANLFLLPLIFLWQILYSFFRYAETLKREPGFLGSRKWSLYARLYLRHLNELDHEFDARLNRGYKAAERYMGIFVSPLITIVAKHTAFFAGSILAVFIILTLVDEDFLGVQHVIAIMTGLGVLVTICRACIPDEHMVWCPELLMRQILAQVHYMPDHWKGQAHTYNVRDEFANLFQYKAIYLLEEVVSPIVTPLVLCFSIRHKALDIVDFFRNFTIDVTGVGDVCSFAQMDVRKHGNPEWVEESVQVEANQYEQAEHGKTELSLIHFTLTNPEWKPPQTGNQFLSHLRQQAHKDANRINMLPGENPLISSLHSLSGGGAMAPMGYHSVLSSMYQPNVASPDVNVQGHTNPMWGQQGRPLQESMASSTKTQMSGGSVVRGGVRNIEGPPGYMHPGGMLTSLHSSSVFMSGMASQYPSMSQHPSASQYPSQYPSQHPSQQPTSPGGITEGALELMSTEMSLSTLYLHQLHHRRCHMISHYRGGPPPQRPQGDTHERALWQVMEGSTHNPQSVARLEEIEMRPQVSPSRSNVGPVRLATHLERSGSEDDRRNENLPLLQNIRQAPS